MPAVMMIITEDFIAIAKINRSVLTDTATLKYQSQQSASPQGWWAQLRQSFMMIICSITLSPHHLPVQCHHTHHPNPNAATHIVCAYYYQGVAALCVSSGTGRRCGLRAGAGLRLAALARR
jgi:hypothetical protein